MCRNFRKRYYCKQMKGKIVESATTTAINCDPNSNCRQCRLKQCLAAGMSFDEVVIGRHTKDIRKKIDAAVEQLSKGERILQAPLFRRARKPKTEDEEHDDDGTTEDASMDKAGPSSDSSMTKFTFTQARNRLESAASSFSSSSSSSADYWRRHHLTSTTLTSGMGGSSGIVSIPMVPSNVTFKANASLELAIAGALPPYRNIQNPHIEASEWLIDRAAEAVARLAPIATVGSIVDPL